jgi:hypothetical protein
MGGETDKDTRNDPTAIASADVDAMRDKVAEIATGIAGKVNGDSHKARVVAAGGAAAEKERSTQGGESWAYCDSMLDTVLEQAGAKASRGSEKLSYTANISKTENLTGVDKLMASAGKPDDYVHVRKGDVIVWEGHYALAVGDEYMKDGKRTVPTFNPNGDGGNTTIVDMDLMKFTDPKYVAAHPHPGALKGIVPLEKVMETSAAINQNRTSKHPGELVMHLPPKERNLQEKPHKYDSLYSAVLADVSATMARLGVAAGNQDMSGFASTPGNLSTGMKRTV